MKICINSLTSIRVDGDDTASKTSRIRRENVLFARDFGNAIEQKYGSSAEGMKIACDAWKSFVNRANGNLYVSKQDAETLPSYVEKIQKIDPSFNFVAKKRGCF